jgi:P27 family predicted phage terminase small subunit
MSGTPKRDKAIRILQIRDGAPPPAPPDLDAETWAQIFQDGRHLTARDERLVGLLCRLIADARDLRAMMAIEGRIVDGTRGTRAAHPAARLLKDTEASIVAVSSALVLTPAARARAAMAQEPPPEDRVGSYRDKMALLARISTNNTAHLEEPGRDLSQAESHEASPRRREAKPAKSHPADAATNGNNRHKE